jgi:poly-gamma-glutamate synthesis protein (capsule biosynthesis protein)
VVDGISITEKSLALHGLETIGAGKSDYAASQEKTTSSGENKYLVIGFGWPVIGCRAAIGNRPGVNRFESQNVRQQATEIIRRVDHARVIVVIHGNYEFERYPQPAHRKLAFQLIDLGVYAVIFHHPHIVSPVERYKGRTIAYSLGNWAFSHSKFFSGKLRFPESSFHQIAVELGSEIDTVHHARFFPPATVTYEFSENVDSGDFSLKPVFEGFSHDEYIRWFKKNRLKRKLLPIYREPDNSVGNWIRDRWVAGRQVLIDAAAKSGFKAMRRST